jgi:uncharacterized membrane protein
MRVATLVRRSTRHAASAIGASYRSSWRFAIENGNRRSEELVSSPIAQVDLETAPARRNDADARLFMTVAAMCSAAIALFLIGISAARHEIAAARRLGKVLALTHVCYAIPLAVFGALHIFGPRFVAPLVPRYMPWRMFWVYFVGGALIAAALSIATRTAVRWSGLLVGLMMFSFVAMIHLPGALARPHDRIIWTIVVREMSFGGGAWLLAGSAPGAWRRPHKTTLLAVGRIAVAIAAVFFGIEHFLHPMGMPGVPLQKQMPAWIPGRVVIDYATGAALLVAAGSIVLARNTRIVATCLGGWIGILVLGVCGPGLILALTEPTTAAMEGINYFADTLLFAGTILAVASASPASD